MGGEDHQHKPREDARSPPSHETLESWFAAGLAEWEAYKSCLPSNSVLPPQIAALYAGNPQDQSAQMLNSLALAASLQHNFETGRNKPSPARPIPQRLQAQTNLEGKSLPSHVSKRSLVQQAESGTPKKRSKSASNLAAMEEFDSSNGNASPLARRRHNSITASKLQAILEKDQSAEARLDGDTLLFGTEADAPDEEDPEGFQDDRDAKKIRRKQSNRESARRSRLRKQRESEALSSSVAGLKQENQQLKEVNKSLQTRVEELTEQIAQGNLGKEPTLQSSLPQKFSAFQVVQRKTSDTSKSADSQTHALSPQYNMLARQQCPAEITEPKQ